MLPGNTDGPGEKVTRVLTLAHRGASGYAPENTRAAFDLAISMGASMIETDVQITRDRALVLFHDDLVDRTSNGHGPLADYTLEDLRRLDVGSWFAGSGPQRIVTLAEFWADYLPRIPVCLEIKDPLAADELVHFLASAGTPANDIHITSFSWSALLRARDHVPFPVGFLGRTFDDDLVRRCAARGFAQVCPPVHLLDEDLVKRAHRRGLTVRAWGVRERADVDRLFETGADGATTNWPDWILDHPRYLERSGQ